MTLMDVPAGTILVWSDIGCPWAHLTVHRLHETRTRLGLDGVVTFEHLAFPIELFNYSCTRKTMLEAELPVLGALAPAAGWQLWQRREWEWPVTMLPPLEAVRAARIQGPEAADALDRALRIAFWGHSKCISMRHVILEIAEDCVAVDEDRLEADFDTGVARHRVIEEWRRAAAGDVRGSPHLFLPDGTDMHNPGIRTHWEGEHGVGFPVIDADDPSVFDDVLTRAAGPT